MTVLVKQRIIIDVVAGVPDELANATVEDLQAARAATHEEIAKYPEVIQTVIAKVGLLDDPQFVVSTLLGEYAAEAIRRNLGETYGYGQCEDFRIVGVSYGDSPDRVEPPDGVKPQIVLVKTDKSEPVESTV